MCQYLAQKQIQVREKFHALPFHAPYPFYALTKGVKNYAFRFGKRPFFTVYVFFTPYSFFYVFILIKYSISRPTPYALFCALCVIKRGNDVHRTS